MGLDCLEHTARGLDYLHLCSKDGHWVHRDVKPENVLRYGPIWKLADFGSAVFLLKGSVQAPVLAMTLPYAPPEFSAGKATPQSDLYSLAIMACEVLGGRLPFKNYDEVLKRTPDLSMLPEKLWPIVRRALSIDPWSRGASCLKFVEELRAVTGCQRQGESTTRADEKQKEMLKWAELVVAVRTHANLAGAILSCKVGVDGRLAIDRLAAKKFGKSPIHGQLLALRKELLAEEIAIMEKDCECSREQHMALIVKRDALFLRAADAILAWHEKSKVPLANGHEIVAPIAGLRAERNKHGLDFWKCDQALMKGIAEVPDVEEQLKAISNLLPGFQVRSGQ
ncbi:hypothetical protein AYO44_12310 [Planctomycetaceae bacterium SCGC AG-212-F19]|nr:hypothetical protein AYO44_12310 [Planctomycetaceae bacterium SCGC AG-212-F19]